MATSDGGATSGDGGAGAGGSAAAAAAGAGAGAGAAVMALHKLVLILPLVPSMLQPRQTHQDVESPRANSGLAWRAPNTSRYRGREHELLHERRGSSYWGEEASRPPRRCDREREDGAVKEGILEAMQSSHANRDRTRATVLRLSSPASIPPSGLVK